MFCVALWEALHGEPPFAAGNVADLITAVLDGALRTPVKAATPA